VEYAESGLLKVAFRPLEAYKELYLFLSIRHLSQNQKDAIAELLHCYLVNSSKDLRALTLVKIIHSLNL